MEIYSSVVAPILAYSFLPKGKKHDKDILHDEPTRIDEAARIPSDGAVRAQC